MKKRKQALDLMRINPTQQRAEITVGAVYDAAARILDREGLPGLNTNKIAETAGISVGTLYYFFPNKAAILNGMALRELERLRNALQDLLENPAPFGTGENVRRLIRAYVSVFGTASRAHRLLHKTIVDSATPSPVAEARDKLHGELFNAIMEHNAGQTQLSPMMRWILFRGLLGIVQAAVDHYPEALGSGQLEEELSRMVRGMFVQRMAALADRTGDPATRPHAPPSAHALNNFDA
jgi:AcrR family transcriptional regulator